MEDLNKNQIVLLTLLVSFVTSIATGIMTVSLLQVAPVEITRNINSIVEKTVQTVVPANPLSNSPSKEVTTIVVNEDDSVTQSVDKNVKSLVRIQEKDAASVITFYGMGLIVTKDGLIAADRKTITAVNIYTAITNDGTVLPLTPTGVDKQTNFILFKTVAPEKTPYVFVPVTLSASIPKLGQTVISLGGDTSNAVSVGRVTSLLMKDSGTGTTTTQYLDSIDTDVSTKDLVNGSPVLNLSGEVIGVALSDDTSKSFTPIAMLTKELLVLTPTPTPVAPKTQ